MGLEQNAFRDAVQFLEWAEHFRPSLRILSSIYSRRLEKIPRVLPHWNPVAPEQYITSSSTRTRAAAQPAPVNMGVMKRARSVMNSRRTRVRWRGTVLAAFSVIGFFAVFYRSYGDGVATDRVWLWVFATGAILGGALSFFDSLKQNLSGRTGGADGRK